MIASNLFLLLCLALSPGLWVLFAWPTMPPALAVALSPGYWVWWCWERLEAFVERQRSQGGG